MPTRILVTLPTELQETFFTQPIRDQLEALGTVEYNDNDQFSRDELADRVADVDILMTGWGTPTVDGEVLDAADQLELITHTGGSVAEIASEGAYDRGITVCSANRLMAKFVAEHTLGQIIGTHRSIVQSDRRMRNGGYERDLPGRSVFESTIGLIGLGTVGRYLIGLLHPFNIDISVYDPYVSPAEVAEYDFVEKATLEAALDSDIVSLHAARTPETIGMIGEAELATIPDDGLLVNTARAELIDEDALMAELESGRLRAALDVYHEEPLPSDHRLRELDNTVLTPHIGGSRIRTPYTEAMIDEIERHLEGRAFQHEITREQFELMTR